MGVAMVRLLLWPRVQGQVNRWKRGSRAERLTAGLFFGMALLFWVGIFGLFAWVVSSFHQVEVFGPILSRKLLELLMLGLFALLCFSNVVMALSTFYLSDDLELVLSLPVSRPTFHMARLLDTMVQSSWMVLAFGAPILGAYAYAYGAGWTFWVVALLVTPAFLLIPASFGVAVASVLVSVFPARRIREALVGLGILCLVFVFVLLRLVRPERLVDAESFESVAAYVAELQSPVPLLVPPRWAAEVLTVGLMDRPMAWMELGLLLSCAMASVGVGRWITQWRFDEGRTRAQEARQARLAKSPWLDKAIALWTLPLPPKGRVMVTKDVKSFVRDPSQWTQLLLVGSIVIITLASISALPLDVFKGPWMEASRNGIAFMVLGLNGFVMAAVAARFQFTSVSTEGRAFWVLRTAPVDPISMLRAKTWPSLWPMIFVGQTLALLSSLILGAGPFFVALSVGTALFLALGISGVAVGMGAMYPDFKADNAARVASGPAGVLFMVMSLSLVFAVLALEILPVYILLAAAFREEALTALDWVGVVTPLIGVALLCVGVGHFALVRGARSLWARELPNG
jgi:ABC-2 type transport system permease protein